jgi:hypothetical protein
MNYKFIDRNVTLTFLPNSYLTSVERLLMKIFLQYLHLDDIYLWFSLSNKAVSNHLYISLRCFMQCHIESTHKSTYEMVHP